MIGILLASSLTFVALAYLCRWFINASLGTNPIALARATINGLEGPQLWANIARLIFIALSVLCLLAAVWMWVIS